MINFNELYIIQIKFTDYFGTYSSGHLPSNFCCPVCMFYLPVIKWSSLLC